MSSTTSEALITSQAVIARPRDERRVSLLVLCLLALGVGIMTGVGAVALRSLIGLIHNAMFNGVLKIAYDANFLEGPSRFGNWVILSPVLGGLVVVYLVDRFAPEAKGHGVPEVMDAIYYKRGDIRGVVALIKSLASALSIGSGASVGREGPIIQIGSALGSSFSKAIGLSTGQKITLLSAGAGAGIAATFNTPLGGVLFAIEILLPEVSNRTFCRSSSRRARRRSSGASSSVQTRPSRCLRSSFRPRVPLASKRRSRTSAWAHCAAWPPGPSSGCSCLWKTAFRSCRAACTRKTSLA
jgi:H+/Cl- antiporter ClcA